MPEVSTTQPKAQADILLTSGKRFSDGTQAEEERRHAAELAVALQAARAMTDKLHEERDAIRSQLQVRPHPHHSLPLIALPSTSSSTASTHALALALCLCPVRAQAAQAHLEEADEEHEELDGTIGVLQSDLRAAEAAAEEATALTEQAAAAARGGGPAFEFQGPLLKPLLNFEGRI